MTDKKLSDVEIDGYLSRMRSLAAVMLRTENLTDEGMPGCWFGGQPTLPEHIEWPMFHNTMDDIKVPLHFLFQVNLRFVPRGLSFPEFPRRGTLFVFIEPIMAQDGDAFPIPPFLSGEGAKVIYVAEDVHDCPPREMPPLNFTMVDVECCDVFMDPAEIKPSQPWPMIFLVSETYPGFDFVTSRDQDLDTETVKGIQFPEKRRDQRQSPFMDVFFAADLPRAADEEYCAEFCASESDRRGVARSCHAAFGCSVMDNFFSEMHVKSVYKHKNTANIPVLTKNHIQLFHIYSGDQYFDLNMNHAFLSFWIDKDDLAAGNFSNVFTIFL